MTDKDNPIYGGRVLSWNTTRGCTVIICVQLRRERKQYFGEANLQEKKKQLVEEYPAVNSPNISVFPSQSFALNAEGFSANLTGITGRRMADIGAWFSLPILFNFVPIF